MNITKYLETIKDEPITELNEIDRAMFASLSYVPFEYFIRQNIKEVTIKEVAEYYNKKKLIDKSFGLNIGKSMIKEMALLNRYKDLIITDFYSARDTKKETQFQALTLLLPNKRVFVSFRGTDTSVLGWKEDLNLAINNTIPGELLAKEYLHRMMKKYRRCSFYVGGHSKGGILAIYAASYVKRRKQKKIISVTDLDSPGFQNDVLSFKGYQRMLSKIETFIPQSSVVGMVFRKKQAINIVKARGVGIFQHNIFTWFIKDNRFDRLKELSSGEELDEGFLNEAISTLDEDEMKFYIDSLYRILDKDKEDISLTHLTRAHYFINAIKQYRGLSKEDKKRFKDVTKTLLKAPFKRKNKNKE